MEYKAVFDDITPAKYKTTHTTAATVDATTIFIHKTIFEQTACAFFM